jgi:hypothetical protein
MVFEILFGPSFALLNINPGPLGGYVQNSKGFSGRIEKWSKYLPGIRTYREREHRREVDKKLREHLSSHLQESRTQIKNLILHLSQDGQFTYLGELDRISSRIQQMADTIQYASYGYGGIFDLEKIREEELDQLYSFDLSLMDDWKQIQAKVSEITDRDLSLEIRKNLIQEIGGLLETLELKFRKRNEFLNRPA